MYDTDAAINARLAEHLKETIKTNPNIHDWFIIATNGSLNYDLATVDSDLDSKLLTIPSLHQLIWGNDINYLHVMSDNEEHVEVKDVRIYFRTMMKQNINFIETLYAKVVFVNPKYKDLWDTFVDMRDLISFADPIASLNCMMGMARQKRKDMVTWTPSRAASIEKFGYDTKSFHHLIRLCGFAGCFIRGESYFDCLTNPKRPQFRDFLICLKQNGDGLDRESAEEVADYWIESADYKVQNFISTVKPLPFHEYRDMIQDIMNDIIEEIITRSLEQ